MAAVAAPPADAQPDLTNGGVPDHPYHTNLGPTGIKAWAAIQGISTERSRQFLVTHVDAGSPADGIMAVDDVILGASGTGADPGLFDIDALKAMGWAIADAEARSPATLKLLRWRAGETQTVQIQLQTLGAYSATAPYHCEKSATILEQGLQHVMDHQDAGKFSFNTLSLLAGNDPDNPRNAERQARAREEARALILPREEIERRLAGYFPTTKDSSKRPWQTGHRLIVLSEYYQQTGDPDVLDTIEALAMEIANGQSLLGTVGHSYAEFRKSDGLKLHVGYGPVNASGLPCFYGLLLARACGLDHPTILAGIERGSRFFGAYSGYGTIPYGENMPIATNHTANGRSGLAALCFAMDDNRPDAVQFFTKMAVASGSMRQQGHSGPFFNYVWSPLGAHVGGIEAAAAHFKSISWFLDLSRTWDGGFEMTWRAGSGLDRMRWNEFWASTAHLLTYAMPLKQIVSTGSTQNPDWWLSSEEVDAADFGNDYDPDGYSTGDLVRHLASWSPVIRGQAAVALGSRSEEHDLLVPQLLEILTDPTAGDQRLGACMALGRMADRRAAVELCKLLTDEDDLLRFTAAESMRYLPWSITMEFINEVMSAAVSTGKPFFPLDDRDPMHFANCKIAMLLFYGGNSSGPKGLANGDRHVHADRELLHDAIRAVAMVPMGRARATLSKTFPSLARADVEAVSGTIIDSVINNAPCEAMFSGSIRLSGVDALEAHHFAEGIPLASLLVEDSELQTAHRRSAFVPLTRYAGACEMVNPDPGIRDICNRLIFYDVFATEARSVIDAIAADSTPTAPTPLKSIHSVVADASVLKLPTRRVSLQASAQDLARGDSIFTWRKLHGAGEVIFTPNASTDAHETIVTFDGIPGSYLFEVTMTDSRGLTEVSDTVSVTLALSDGTLLANAPPSADAQALTVASALATPVILTGNDPESLPLVYELTASPAHGLISGEPPYLTYTSDIGFLGQDVIAFRVIDSEGQMASAEISITVDAASQYPVAIYEPFDYPVGSLDGQSGTSEVGLLGTWSANSSQIGLREGSLTYGPLPIHGNRYAESPSFRYHWGGSRSIDPSALADTGMLDDGATLWFSMIAGMGETSNTTNDWIAVVLANNPCAESRDPWVDDDGAQAGTGVGLMISKRKTRAVRLWSNPTEPTMGSFANPGKEYAAGEFGLIIGRIRWASDPTADDIIELFHPDVDLRLPELPTSVLRTTVDQSTFDTLTFAQSQHVIVDEIRFGPSYQSVLVGNAPMVRDTIAPSQQPPGFLTPPTPVGGTSATMQAVTEYDPAGVEYYFACTSGGGNDSGWQASPSYTDSGLTPGTSYSYTVTVRDLSPSYNESPPSSAATVTLPTELLVPDVVGVTESAAVAVLANHGLSAGTITRVHDPEVPLGVILSQSPAADAMCPVSGQVSLVVSSGPDVEMPGLMRHRIVDDQAGGTVTSRTPVTYTVTFNTQMDASAVDAADFANAGTAAIQIASLTMITPAVYELVVIPNSPGTLEFGVMAAADLRDPYGNPLDTSIAITDDHTLQVVTPYDAWAGNFPGILPTDPRADADSGGLSTDLEWLLGGDPSDPADDTAITPICDNSDPDYLTFWFRRSDAAANDPATIVRIEYGDTLIDWLPAAHNGSSVITTIYDDGAEPGVDWVAVQLHRSLSPGQSLFARLRVDVTSP